MAYLIFGAVVVIMYLYFDQPWSKKWLLDKSVRLYYEEEPRYGDRTLRMKFFEPGTYQVLCQSKGSEDIHETYIVTDVLDEKGRVIGKQHTIAVLKDPFTVRVTVTAKEKCESVALHLYQ